MKADFCGKIIEKPALYNHEMMDQPFCVIKTQELVQTEDASQWIDAQHPLLLKDPIINVIVWGEAALYAASVLENEQQIHCVGLLETEHFEGEWSFVLTHLSSLNTDSSSGKIPDEDVACIRIGEKTFPLMDKSAHYRTMWGPFSALKTNEPR